MALARAVALDQFVGVQRASDARCPVISVMLVVETVARTRRKFFVKGKSIKEIVRDLGVSRSTVSKVLRSGETAFAYARSVQPLPKLGP